MPTIKDVALEAGVSIASVSKVVNDANYGSMKTRMRVMAAIEKLGYQPSSIARSMVMGRTNIIALVIPDIRNQFFTSLARGVEDVASKYEYRVMLCNTDEDTDKQRGYVDTFRSKIVDGFIISVASERDKCLGRVNRQSLPFVLIDRLCKGVSADAVIVDNKDGAFKAVSHLLQLGHRRIGLIGGKSDTLTGRERLRGYREAYRTLGMECDREIVKDGGFTIEGGYRATKALLDLKNCPTALFIANNAMTIGSLKALAEAKVKIPDEMSVIGFDDSDWAEFFAPPLTVVRQPTYSMGTLAGEILFQRILGEGPRDWQEVVLRPELIIRSSCKPVS